MSDLESDFENIDEIINSNEEVGDVLNGRKYEEVKSEMANVNEVESFSRECQDAKDIKSEEEENTIDSIECSFCKKNIPRANIRDHTKAHMQLSYHICPHCGKAFPDSTKLNGYIRTHTGEKPYQCKM